MPERPLFLLSPYRPPTSYPITLSAGEAAAWLNGWAALWHPATLLNAARVAVAASSYDHDEPVPHGVYALPTGPTLYQPGDWPERLAAVNACTFSATPDREETFQNLFTALGVSPVFAETAPLFTAVGFAYLTIETWFDAAQHDHLLDADSFWADIRKALELPGDVSHVRTHLKSACEKLQYAREVLHAGQLKILDVVAPEIKPTSTGPSLQSQGGEENKTTCWPASLANGLPLTVLASAETIEKLPPDRLAELLAKCPAGLPASVEFACGSVRDRDDVLLPLESQLWNLSQARQRLTKHTGQTSGLYARTHAATHLHLPSWLGHMGYRHAIATPITGDGQPTTKSPCLQWPGPDGKTVEAWSKDFLFADDDQTFFNLAYYLHTASGQEATPALALLHRQSPASPAYHDVVNLADLCAALGEWQTVGQYLTDVGTGDYCGVAGPDDFAVDVLDTRVTSRAPDRPVSAFVDALRTRRRIDAAFGLAALQRSLGAEAADETQDMESLNSIESDFEITNPDGPFDDSNLTAIETRIGERLAQRIVQRGEANRPGYLLLNPCNYTRRVALELPPFAGPVAIDGPIKAAQFDADRTRLVVEVPSLGFAWIPQSGQAVPPKPKLVMAQGTIVRNEFFEAEFDPATGGLRAFRDLKNRSQRIALVPVFNPGCKTRGTEIRITHNGSALGEIVSSGELVSDVDEPLAKFTLRARAWLGRPVLELRTTWELTHSPTGYPWHAYFGLRLGVRDDRIAVYRGINGTSHPCHSSRIMSPDFFEFRFGRERSFVFPGGVAFLNKVSPKTYDLIHIPERETARTFDCLLSLDRDNPMQTAAGWVAPTAVVPVDRGPPPTGAASWLAHVDMPSLIATDFRPASPTTPEATRAITMRLFESTGYAGTTDVRFARDPVRVFQIDGQGETLNEITLTDGAAKLDYSANELIRLRAEW